MYENLEASLHDLFWEQEDVLSELPLLETFHAQLPSLEIGSGSGRLLLPLLKNGCPIEGVEISADMVELFKENAKAAELDAKVYQQDILEFEPSSKYQRISIPAFTLQLLKREDVPTLLSKLHNWTKDDGKIYFTVFIPWAEIAGELDEGTWYEDHQVDLSGGKTAECKTKFTINRLQQFLLRNHHYTITTKNGRKQEHRSRQMVQWYTLPELTVLLSSSGWNIEKLITDLEPDSAPESNAHLLTAITEKVHS